MTAISSASSSAAANAYYLANGGEFLQSIQTSGNWLMDASSTDTANWMDPSSTGPDTVGLAANAFAKATQLQTSYTGSLAVNQGILSLQAQLNGQVGSQVNIFA